MDTERGLDPFDPNRYRKTVLARVLAEGIESSDPFELYDLPLAVVPSLSDDTVDQRVAEVWAFWQKSREHPKYGGLVTALLAGHRERAEQVLDRDARFALAAASDRHRAEVDSQRFLALDTAIERLRERFGGVPESKVEGLERLGASAGLSREDVTRRLGGVPVLPSRAAPARLAAPPPGVLRQIRADLDEVGRLTGQTAPTSLHDLLGLEPDSPADVVRRRVEALAGRNRERRPDRLRAVLDDLFTAATRLLVDGDPDAYLDALVQEVAEVLRPRLAVAVLVEDQLLPDDADHLVGEAVAAGLDRERARALVARLASEAGTVMPAAARPSRTSPSQAQAQSRPRADAPASDRPSASAWHEALSRARAALRAGRLGEARRELSTANRLAGEMLPPLRAVADEIDTVAREVATRWATVASALPARRYVEALAALDRLLTLAADEPGPDGQQASVLHADVRRRVDRADVAVAAATSSAGADLENALLAVLQDVTDHAGALEALTSVGVAPPAAVRAERHARSVVIRWDRSTSGGTVTYKVTRVADARVVGRTSTCEIEDGSAPSGAVGVYAVVAVRAGVASPPARSDDPPSPPPQTQPTGDAPPTVLVTRPTATAHVEALQTEAPLTVHASRGRACFRYPPGLAVVREDGMAVEEVDDGCAVDPAPLAGRTTYRLLDGDREVANGEFVALPPVTDVGVSDGLLTFAWPPGCTEVLVEWTDDAGQVDRRKVTNSRYAIDGGVPVTGAVELTVRTCTRVDGALVAATKPAGWARARPS